MRVSAGLIFLLLFCCMGVFSGEEKAPLKIYSYEPLKMTFCDCADLSTAQLPASLLPTSGDVQENPILTEAKKLKSGVLILSIGADVSLPDQKGQQAMFGMDAQTPFWLSSINNFKVTSHVDFEAAMKEIALGAVVVFKAKCLVDAGGYDVESGASKRGGHQKNRKRKRYVKTLTCRFIFPAKGNNL